MRMGTWWMRKKAEGEAEDAANVSSSGDVVDHDIILSERRGHGACWQEKGIPAA